MIRLFGALLVWICALPSLCGVWPASEITEFAALSALPILSLMWLIVPGRKIENLTRVSIVLAAASIALTVTDIACRLFLANLIFARTNEQYVRRLPANPELRRYVPGLNVRAMVVGDLGTLSDRKTDREQREEFLVTDSYGFRNEINPTHAEETQLLFLGDSVTAGVGTTQEQTFPALVAQRTGFSTYNLAMTYSSAPHQFMNLLLEAGRIKFAPGARLVLVVFGANDLFEAGRSVSELKAATISDTMKKRQVIVQDFRKRSPLRRILGIFSSSFSQPAPQVVARELASGRRILFFRPYIEHLRLSAEDISNMPEWKNYQEAFTQIVSFCRQKGLKLQVLFAPAKEEIYGWAAEDSVPWLEPYAPSSFTSLLQETCRQQDIQCHDAGPEIYERAKWWHEERNALLWWHDDTHLNPEGHRAFADIVTMLLEPALID